MKAMNRSIAKIGFAIAFLCGAIWFVVAYFNWSAEREAQALCDSIQLGSNVVSTIRNFEKKLGIVNEPGRKESVRHYGYPDTGPYTDGHRFMFFGMWMDKAYCDVSLRADGTVKAKSAYLLEE